LLLQSSWSLPMCQVEQPTISTSNGSSARRSTVPISCKRGSQDAVEARAWAIAPAAASVLP
jgi:hypothetical protein